MSSFKRTKYQIFSKPRPPITPETRYWNQLGAPVLLKEFGAIDYVDFSPIEPYYFAVTCSVKVQLYNPITRNVTKNFNKFRENAYGATFRSDGMLLIAGGEEGVLRLFDVNSKSLLRVFKGHTGAVHRTYFMSDKTRLVSFSDDKTASTWDIPCEQKLQTFKGHDDYVRAGCPSPVSPNIFLSGSYDGKVRLFDDRKGVDPVFVIDHGSPVECVASLPSGGIFLSAGGTEIRVWDTFNNGRMLAKLSQHHKSVTCLRVSSNGSRFFSGSLDRHVKVFSVSNYQPVHTFDYPNSILSLGISPNDETLVVGMMDGLISVRRQETEVSSQKSVKKKISSRFAGDSYKQIPPVDDVAPALVRYKERKYDKHFRKFEYSKVLNQALHGKYSRRVVVSTLLELIRRKGLHQAIAGSEDVNLLIFFIIKNIGDYRFTRVLIDVANIILDVYSNKFDDLPSTTSKNLRKLKQRILEEYQLTLKLAALQGALQMVLSAKSTNYDYIQQSGKTMEPTEAARENFVIAIN